MRHSGLLIPAILILGLSALSGSAAAQTGQVSERPRAVYDDYREGAGWMEDGVWKLRLTAREVAWHPRGEEGPELTAYGFAAGDDPPQVPGPMIRVTAGTPVEVTVRNGLDRALVLRGLNDRTDAEDAEPPGGAPFLRPFGEGTLELEPGEEGTVITVRRGAGEVEALPPVARRLHLYTGRRDGMVGDDPGYGFVLRDGDAVPAPDSVLVPGSPLVLTRGEMTEIVVHNRLDFPFAVHWHGLELASRYDGVADWSGEEGRTVPAIAPGDSLAVRIMPTRAGTFMYHVHSEPGHQLSQGMYGPFLVLEPGETFDAERDRLFVLGSSGTDINAQEPVVNGVTQPLPLEFRETYRLRFMHISADDEKSIRLVHNDEPETWRALARDGADLPTSRAVEEPARVTVLGVGETRDYLWTPSSAGERTLIIETLHYGATGRPVSEVRIPVRIRDG